MRWRRAASTSLPIPWTELDPYAVIDAPPIVLRSTWDYHRDADDVRCVAGCAGGFRTRDVESAAMSRAATSTRSICRRSRRRGSRSRKRDGSIASTTRSLDRALDEEGWDRAVLKPRIAATAYGTFLISRGAALSDEELAPARATGALLQEVVPEIVAHGETSIVYAGGAFSHAVQKRAKDGEFRVQQDFGGRVEPASPSATLLSFAATVMTHVPDTCLYARVDVVESSRGPLLMELELIEPELYFLIVPEAADRMAQLIVERLA